MTTKLQAKNQMKNEIARIAKKGTPKERIIRSNIKLYYSKKLDRWVTIPED